LVSDSEFSKEDIANSDDIDFSTDVALSYLAVTKSTSPDKLSTYYLREVANEIVVPLTKLYSESLHTGITPREWKQLHITAIHKGGPTDDPSNYHPISVVPI